ncbi:gliding motility-associated C-terminal domain-containing protein, partial [Flavobacterium sp.]|uniref:DUF7507 domain-containing protein n=1 Tax=Flavobacterium sp. TaxID=239 RepID=UPI00263064BF
CAATSDEVTITRYKNPSTANAGMDQTQCETATATFAGNTPAVGTGTWTLVSGAGSITSPSSATSGITGLGYGANVFRWTISNGTCAATSDEVTITRYKNPSTANAGIDQTQCGNGNFTVTANIATVGIGTWTIESGSGSIADINSASTEILNIPIGTSIVLKWKIVNGNCSTEDTIILHNNNCSIDITKDGVYVDSNNDGKTNVGDIVFYNFVIKNTGNVTLTNVTVTDNNAMINGGPIASLAVGASDSTTFSGTHVITQEDINKGYVYNLALATAKDPNDKPVTDTSSDPTPCATCPKNPECADCTITELNQNPSIEVVKTAITTSFAKVGDIINYVITVKNNGNVTLNQVMIKDPLTGLNTTIEVLVTGETREFPQSYMVTQEDLNKGSVLNIASASGKDPKGNTVSDEDSEIVSEKETPIDAVNDTAGPIVGVNQITTNVINVFTNDTLNGTAVKPNDVILTTDNSNPYLHLNEDGSVDVLANAPEGTLTLNYQLCEKLNTSNCDTATVTITIVKPVMTVTTEPICINDVPYLKYSATAVNFTPTNGVTLTWMDNTNKIVSTMTNLPLSGQVLWPGATVDANGIGTDWPGWLLVDNKWIQGADGFENIRPTASVTFALNPEVTVILNYPPSDPFCTSRPTFKIDAVDDTAGPINGFYGESNIINVFTNDTLNTVAVNPKEVNLKEITNSSNGLLTLNSNGFVDVKPNTPSGTYQITYQICEKADASNCDTAVVTVTVINTPPAAPPIPIFAEDDLVKNVNGATGATKILNILTNDVLDKKTPTLNTVTLTLVTPDPTGSLTLNLDGTIDVKAGTPAGTYTFVYQICEIGKPTNCDTATVTVTVMCNDFTKVYGKITNVDTNTPLSNVPITLKPLNGTPGPVLFRVTKADGSYSFDNMVAGEYVLQVQDANLNSAYELFNTTPSFLIIKVEKCNYSKSDFGYGKTDLPVLGDFVWYDLNNNGKQDEWYDANNDNLVTQNIPDANGVIDYSKWEWIDFNGDGSYKGIQNIGELNAAGFGNGTTNVPNIYITGPNGFSRTVTMGILGYWRTRPAAGAYGEYRIEIKEEPLLEAASQAIAATGLVKVLPTKGGKAITTKSYKTSSYIDCGTTTNNVLFATLTDQKRVNLDIDFGISCKTFTGVDAIDDTYNLVQCSQTGLIGNVITNNDLLNGIKVTPTYINFKIITGSNPFITFDSTGNLSILSGISTGKYVFTYQICNTKYPNDCDTATVSIEITPIPAIAINSSACNADTSVIDLNTLLPTNIPTGGTWIDSNNSSALKGNLFSAYELAVGDYQLEYKITNGDCPNRVVINMNVNNDCKVLGCGTVIIHNAFTPNGDGLNEIFKIENIDDTICYPENTLEVYNRWGVLVFETKNYNNSTNHFDGVSRGRTTIMQGSGLPTGTYFYILNYTSFDSNGNAVENKKDGYLYLSK